jgi:pimeloyl-ACP methyl ester carboxylesterase
MTGRRVHIAALVSAIVLAAGCGPEGGEEFDITGHWEGKVTIVGMDLAIMVDFTRAGNEPVTGTIDVPEQGAYDLPLEGITVNGDSVGFDLPSNLGLASFRGTVVDGVLKGTYSQGGYEGTFELFRAEPVALDPLPYTEEDVVINGSNCILAGTISIPKGEPPFPGIALYTGSGSQDRNESVMGFRVFGVLADHLTRSGIAVLRCDDRGFGESTGSLEGVTDSVFAYDATLMLDYMLSREEVDPSRVGLLGHSEGSTVVFMVAAERPDDVAFVVSMAGPSVSGYDILLSQIETLGTEAGLTEQEIARKLAMQKEIMDIVISGEGTSDLSSIFRAEFLSNVEGLSDEEMEMLGDIDEYVDMAVSQSVAQVESDWFRNFIMHDPADEIAAVSCPVLALFGSLDIQVPPDLNREPMETALAANPVHEVIVFEGANHLFQSAVTGSIEEYAALPREFVQGFTGSITDWILWL